MKAQTVKRIKQTSFFVGAVSWVGFLSQINTQPFTSVIGASVALGIVLITIGTVAGPARQ